MTNSIGVGVLRALPLGLRLAAFRGLEALAGWRQPTPAAPAGAAGTGPAGEGARSLWLFVSTIGELNAIAPLLPPLLQALGEPPLTLLFDRPVYAEAYRARHPQARLVVLDGSTAQARALARQAPPLLCVVAEIPALLHDAPCRLSFALLHTAQHAGAPVVLVNGWGYGYAPPSRMDVLESLLFGSDYLRSFDLLLVQTQAFAQRLLAHGAAPERVQVVGNLKFDAMDTRAWSPDAARSPQLLRALLASGRPTVVAGCVTDADEQQRVLDAFAGLRREQPQALLVLAPRHPENPAVIARLRTLLGTLALPHAFRSALAAQGLQAETAVLVLDTLGELRDFYAAAGVAHVGVDHNVLEPLAFDKPVTVSPGWNGTYPSFPVYEMLHRHGVLIEAADAEALCAAWVRCLAPGAAREALQAGARAALAGARGATQRHLQALAPLLATLHAPARGAR